MKPAANDREPREPGIWEPVVALIVLAGLLAVLLSRNAGHLTRIFGVAAVALLLSGCKTSAPWRFVVAEWDSRSPEQLAAATTADTAVFAPAETRAVGEPQPRFTEWVALAKVIGEFRVRLRVLVFERGRETPAAAAQETVKPAALWPPPSSTGTILLRPAEVAK